MPNNVNTNTDAYAEHERSSYARSVGCAEHGTDAECNAFRGGWNAYAAEYSDERLEKEYDRGYSDGLNDGHCCSHSDYD